MYDGVFLSRRQRVYAEWDKGRYYQPTNFFFNIFGPCSFYVCAF